MKLTAQSTDPAERRVCMVYENMQSIAKSALTGNRGNGDA